MTLIARVLVAGLGLILPAAAAAQEGVGLRVTPRVGVARSWNEIGRVAGLDDENFLAVRRIGPTVAFGASAEVGFAGSPWRARASLLGVGETDVTASWDCDLSRGFVCPSILVLPPATASVFAGAMSAVYGSTRPSGPLSSFLMVGAGFKSYSFEWEGASGGWGGFSGGSERRSYPALHLGVGLEWTWRRLSVVVEVEDYANFFGAPGSGIKHDVALSLGGGFDLLR